MQIRVISAIRVYGNYPGYPNEGICLLPSDTATVINPKVAAVSGPNPYFMLVEFERNGATYRAALWPSDEYEIVTA